MDCQDQFYPETRFGGFTDVDATIAFYTRVHSLLSPNTVLLDVGCGRGEYAVDRVQVRRRLRIFKGKVARVIGIDVDRRGRIPFSTSSTCSRTRAGPWTTRRSTCVSRIA